MTTANFCSQVLQLITSNEYTWASTLLVCAGQTVEAVRLLLQCGRAKEALLLFRLRLSPTANPDLLLRCLNLLTERLAHTGLPNSALVHLAVGQTKQASSIVRSFHAINDPPLDHIVSFWTAYTILPDCRLISFKLAHYCIIYAANLSIEEERMRFLLHWRAALSPGSDADFLLNCAGFLLVGAWSEDVNLPGEELIGLATDRQPSVDEAWCLAAVVVDFGVACLNGDSKPLEKSLSILSENHPSLYDNLTERLRLKRSCASAPPPFIDICEIFK